LAHKIGKNLKKQVKRQTEFSLRVAKAFIEDEGKGLARVDEDVLKSVGAVPGDALAPPRPTRNIPVKA
jgi:hypothetical protein